MKRINLFYQNNYLEQRIEHNSIKQASYSSFKSFLRIFNDCVRKKINFQENDLIIILYSGYTNTNVKSISKFIKSNNINKIYFFVEDVFRLTCSDVSMDLLETYGIEKYPDTTEAIELQIIKNIMRKSKVPYDVFHCEYNADFFSKKYNLNIKYFDWFSANVVYNLNNFENFDFNFDKKISCFNLRKEYHRYLISLLLQNNEDAIVTCNFKIRDEELLSNKSLDLNFFDPQLKEEILNSHHNINYNRLVWDLDKNTIDNDCWIDVNFRQQWDNLKIIKNSFLNIVTETRFSSPMPCFNEKTLKPIIVCRPFILLAPPGTLALLKKLGIKTFDQWWDESYDNITDHNKRFEAVYNLCLDILSKSNEELENLLKEMEEILIYNREVLKYFPEKMFDLNQ